MKLEIVKQDEYETLYAVPITLRQAIAHIGINGLEGTFGLDDAETASLMDEQGILRVVFGSLYDQEENAMDDKRYDIEVYQSRLDGSGPKWESCINWRSLPDKNYFSHRGEVLRLMGKIESLVAEVFPEYDVAIESVKKDFEDWIKEVDKMVSEQVEMED